MNRPPSYPHAPGHKGASDTGRDAAEAFHPKLAPRRAEVIEHLRQNGPATAEDIAEATGRHWYVVRPRISELKALGLVTDTGLRRETPFGGRTAVVRLSTAREYADFLATQGEG